MLALAEPIRGIDGQIINAVLVPQGTTILVGVRALNRSKTVWGKDALEWKPERWLSPLPKSVEDARIPGVYANM